MDRRSTIYAGKAEKYARYRWDYQPAAIQAIAARAGLCAGSVVADVGAGTGILTRHLAVLAGRVYAIEPNEEMRAEARKHLSGCPSCAVLEGSAEATGLPGRSVDLVCAAQAIHWFEPEAAQREFRRILKPGGWLAILWNTLDAGPVSADIQAINTPAYGAQTAHPAPWVNLPPEAYFQGGSYERMAWPFTTRQDWEQFIGALCSASFAPDETHPLYPRYEQAAREIFDRHSHSGILSGRGETHLLIGRITGETR